MEDAQAGKTIKEAQEAIAKYSLLQLTYLHRTQPTALVIEILSPLQIKVLKATSRQLPQELTVSWAISAITRLGGYLEHRRRGPIGIQVLWRGLSKLYDLCRGWQLALQT